MAFLDHYEIAAYQQPRRLGFIPALLGAVTALAPSVNKLVAGKKDRSSGGGMDSAAVAQLMAQQERERQLQEEARRIAEARTRKQIAIGGVGLALLTIGAVVVLSKRR